VQGMTARRDGIYFMDTFKKDDNDKVKLAYLPFAQLETIARVLDHGAEKYGRDNWQKGDFTRYASACLRHVFARLKGEKNDPESGLPHLAHAACCILFMMWFDNNRKA
jgi:hypothetical protein